MNPSVDVFARCEDQRANLKDALPYFDVALASLQAITRLDLEVAQRLIIHSPFLPCPPLRSLSVRLVRVTFVRNDLLKLRKHLYAYHNAAIDQLISTEVLSRLTRTHAHSFRQ